MTENRTRLMFPLQETAPMSLAEIVRCLERTGFDAERFYYEVPIAGSFKAHELRRLLRLPFTAFIRGAADRLMLTTGTYSQLPPDTLVELYRQLTGVSLITYPSNGKPSLVRSPSIDLLDLANRKAEKLIYGLGVQEGLIAYGSPAYNPATGQPLEENAIYAFDSYCRNKGVDILHDDAKNGSGLTPLPLLGEAERESLFRELAEKSGAIIAEARWDEPRGLEQVMATIFYRK